MKISKKSWHYILIDRMSDSFPPDNLCDYFWKLIWCIIKVLALSAILLFALISIIIGPFLNHQSVFFEMGIVSWAVIGIVLLSISIIALSEYIGRRKRNPHPSIISEYIKTFKGKYCPKITFKD